MNAHENQTDMFHGLLHIYARTAADLHSNVSALGQMATEMASGDGPNVVSSTTFSMMASVADEAKAYRESLDTQRRFLTIMWQTGHPELRDLVEQIELDPADGLRIVLDYRRDNR